MKASRASAVSLLLVVLLAYPFVDRATQAQTVHAVTDGMIYVLLALGLNIVIGYAGLLDLGYAAFFAIGAYAMGLLNSPLLGSPLYGYQWSFWVVIWISALVSAMLGLVIGAPTLRVRGDYLAIITLGFGEIIPVFIRNLGDVTIEIGSWQPVHRLNLTGGENGVNPVGRPYFPGVDFDNSPIPWYFLILIIGGASLWAMNRLRDSRLGRAWMAIREDETAADCMGVDPIKTKLLAFALGASFSGFAGSFYAAKLQAITPGAFEFNVSIMLLCMVVLGGMGSLKGVIVGGMLITLFDRLLLAQMTHLVRWVGAQTGIAVLTTVDFTLWRWFFFGLGLALVMLFKPEGLVGRRVKSATVDVDETEEAGLLAAAPAAPRAESIPAWLRSGAAPRDAGGRPLLEARGVTKAFGGLVAVNQVDLVIPPRSIVGLIGPNGAGKTTFFNVVTGLLEPDQGQILFEGQSIVGRRPNAIVGRGIARTFQSIRLFQNMSILDNILVGEHSRLSASVAGAVFRPPSVRAEEQRARARALELIQFVGLGGKDQELAKNLPYGDQRRLEIARALATEPKLLLLDEPTAGMNPRETEVLTQFIDMLRRELGLSVLLIEHHMEVVMGISDRITVLDYGTRISEGTPAEVQRDSKVIEAYLGKGYEQELRHGMSGALLDVADIHTYYGSIRALKGVSLTVSRGEIVTLIGSNGAGKTTTLKTVIGNVRPLRGAVTFDGRRIDALSTDRIVRLGIAQSPEGRRIFPRMTVYENLELGAFSRKDRTNIPEDLERVLALFPRLRERLQQKGGTLSGGEQQMLAMGRALMARPSLLLLDEPSMGLSPILVETIFGIVRDINAQGTTILLVEQNARMALRVAHRGYVIQTGRIVLTDTGSELLRSDVVRKAYLGEK